MATATTANPTIDRACEMLVKTLRARIEAEHTGSVGIIFAFANGVFQTVYQPNVEVYRSVAPSPSNAQLSDAVERLRSLMKRTLHASYFGRIGLNVWMVRGAITECEGVWEPTSK